MSRAVEINVNPITNNYIEFTLWCSPVNNNINFIKNKSINITSKRKYATAEVYLNDKIPESIIAFFVKQGIDITTVAHISYIRIIKTRRNTRKNESKHTFTVLNRRNINKTYKNKTYYNSRENIYILSKGYGKVLLNNIEKILKDKGIQYISLIPANQSLIQYYEKLKYKRNTLDDIILNKTNDNTMYKNTEYIEPNTFMYKEL